MIRYLSTVKAGTARPSMIRYSSTVKAAPPATLSQGFSSMGVPPVFGQLMALPVKSNCTGPAVERPTKRTIRNWTSTAHVAMYMPSCTQPCGAPLMFSPAGADGGAGGDHVRLDRPTA